MAGFKDEITRDDGYSYRVSNEIFKRDKSFKEMTPEEAAESLRGEDKDRWKMQNAWASAKGEAPTLPSLEKMLTPKEDKGLFCHKGKARGDMQMIVWQNGFWSALVNVDEPGRPNSKYPMWSLSVLVGNAYKTDAADIRKVIVAIHGEDGYEQWKKAVLADKTGLHSVLDGLADWCGQKKKVAISYTSSPSSERLLKSCGIRVQRDWAFIYPHYKGHWGPREND
ncbi:hypothetical protein [Synechococcus sp. WH 8016]|uniref:hypothetical protein n=1 Tax=Synechococcus sp. WH 8016 TaxID=166318 RepID=UPI00022DA17C|nr:hypothetical protein [Synechococcus sp. WH 8016]EHA64062.1 hypothetical protein Syn8016DRAFT_1104 [Synechococcus sp. WH 8016]